VNTDAQVAAILSGRSGPLGRAIVCEVFAYETGKRLADVVRTTDGLTAVAYLVAEDRVTGDIATITDLTDTAQLVLADPYGTLPGIRLTRAIEAGTAKITLATDSDAWAERRLVGYRAEASPIQRLASLRSRLRIMLRYKQIHQAPAASIRDTEQRLDAAETGLENLLADAEAARQASRQAGFRPRGKRNPHR